MLRNSWLANLVRRKLCPRWQCSSWVCSILSAPAVGACGPGGGGGKPKPPPAPSPPPPPPTPPLVGPAHRLVNCKGHGFWSHDKGEDPGLDQIPLMAPMANIWWQKIRYPIHDPGPGWLVCAEAGVEWSPSQAADFFVHCQAAYGPRLVAGTIWDEPDLWDRYDPGQVDNRVRAIRDRMIGLGSPITFPIGANMSCATGFPDLGIEQIILKGLPNSGGIVWLEAYPLVAGNYEPYVVPALKEALTRLPPLQKIGVVPGVWQPPGQPMPGRDEVLCQWHSWNHPEGSLVEWADRVLVYIYYRWSTDPGAGMSKGAWTNCPACRELSAKLRL